MPSAKPHLSAIILAAGLSRRAAPHNKLLVTLNGRPVVRSLVEAFVGADLDEILVVTGHDRERIETALKGLPVRFIFATDFAKGMGHSLATGIRHAAPDAQGFVVSPSDLPEMTPALIHRVLEAFREQRARKHIIPTLNGERGHPVVLGSWLRLALESLEGDHGARYLLANSTERVRCHFLPVNDPAILRDMDSVPSTPSPSIPGRIT